MLRIHRWVLLTICVLILFGFVNAEAVSIMNVDEVKVGMKGKAKTVIFGTEIGEFDVEVLGVLKDKGPSGDLILIKTSGDIIDKTGGIIEGMSGSPVYIDDRLVGAIAYGWSLADHTIGMMTPIGDMLKLLSYSEPEKIALNKTEQSVEADVQSSAPADNTDNTDKNLNGQSVYAANALMSKKGAFYVSGFGKRGMEWLQKKLKDYDIKETEIAGVPQDVKFPALQAGSALGAELARGDFSMGAIGTVTYAEGDNVLAFGHPFLKSGNCGYFLTNAYMFTSVQGLESGFKVGVTADMIGSVTQDRGAGIAGKLGKYANIVPMAITVKDMDRNVKRIARLQTIDDEMISPILTAAAFADTIDKTIDRSGIGTSRVKFTLSADGMPGGKLERENMFFSPDNITDNSVYELLDILSVLDVNMFNAIDINMLEISSEITAEPKIASIVEARITNPIVKPGDKVQVEVELQPYRGKNIKQVVEVDIPKDQPTGELVLEVRGGGMFPILEVLAGIAQAESGKIKIERKEKKFSDLITQINKLPRNNDIVVEILPIDPSEFSQSSNATDAKSMGQMAKKYIKPFADDELKTNLPPENRESAAGGRRPQTLRGILSTDYIIEDDTQVFLKIVDDGEKIN